MDFATKKLSSSLEKADEPKSLLQMGPIKTISDNFVKIKFSTVASRRKTAKLNTYWNFSLTWWSLDQGWLCRHLEAGLSKPRWTSFPCAPGDGWDWDQVIIHRCFFLPKWSPPLESCYFSPPTWTSPPPPWWWRPRPNQMGHHCKEILWSRAFHLGGSTW